jgi:prolyl-tRNA synthetase
MSREEVLKGGIEAATTATSVAAKTLCKPFEHPPLPEGTKCFVSGLPAKTWVLWGRSY